MMYNKTLKDYSFDLARDMIHLDMERWTDDYLRNDGIEGWMDFLSDPGLTFFLIKEGFAFPDLKLSDVLADQFGWMKIDLALAYALAVVSEQSETSDRLWSILRRIGHVDQYPRYGVTATVQRNQLFKIYQIRRRIRLAFRGLAPDGLSQRFVRASFSKIIAHLASYDIDYRLIITWKIANAAIDQWVWKLEDAGLGYSLRGLLCKRGVLVNPYSDDDSCDDDDDYDI